MNLPKEPPCFQLMPIHLQPEKFKNAALFLRLGLRFTLIRISKTLFKPEEFENVSLSF